ncbi:MAG: RNA polymerase factor sigma-32 [Deltaproteobacteria bacterium]|nr:RNA polymerase factor sigma-32 [Deltaproteobacteria bacterium]
MPDYPPIEVVEESDPPAQDVTAEAVLLDDVDEVAADAEQVEEPSAALVPFDALQRYLYEIRHYPVLTREEEHDLAVQYKELGDIEAAYKLVRANLRLVVMIAREYERAFRNLLDLIQEGNIGLMESLKNFDPYRGVRFPSYAVWWIRAYIIRYLMNNWRMVKLGTTQAQRRLFFNLQKEKEKLEAEGFVPGAKLIAQRLDVKESEVIEMDQRLSGRDLSTDAPMGEGETATLLDTLTDDSPTPEESLAEDEYRQAIKERLKIFGEGLKDKELVVFRERLMAEQPLTLREIGERYGISRERVRQIEHRVKKKLKSYLSEEFEVLEGFNEQA